MDLVRDKRVKAAYMNSTLQNMFLRGELRKDHPLQRKPDQWSKSDKDGLIVTIIKDEDIDSIKVCEQLTENGVVLWVIDGLQRLTALSSYRNGGFKIGNQIEFPIVFYQSVKKGTDGKPIEDEHDSYLYEVVAFDLRGKGYKDLPVELKEKFDNYKIDVEKHLDCTYEEIGYHIRRYNKQKSMNSAQNAVTYMDHIAKEVKKVSLNNRFLQNYDIYTEKERNNGTLDRIVMESVMCMFHLEDWKKQSKKMGTYLNENASKEEFERLNDNLNRLEKIYSQAFGSIFTSKDSFIWFTMFDRFTKFDLDDRIFADFIAAFLGGLYQKKIEGELFYEIDRNKSTKDKAIIVKKLEILEALLLEYVQSVQSKRIKKDDGRADGTNQNRQSMESFGKGQNRLLDFIRQNVDADIAAEDILFYEEVLDDLTLNVDNASKLMEADNHSSLTAIVAYSFLKDVDLDEWIVDFFTREEAYFKNQSKNYQYMKADLERYLKI